MPRGISIKKIIALIHALVKLHNFCINEQPTTETEDDDVVESSAADCFNLMNSASGFIRLDQVGGNVIPTQLLGARSHFEELPRETGHFTWTDYLGNNYTTMS